MGKFKAVGKQGCQYYGVCGHAENCAGCKDYRASVSSKRKYEDAKESA